MKIPWGKVVPFLVKYAPLLIEAILTHKAQEDAAKTTTTPAPPVHHGPA